jgi:xeroderma pigmentosum group C-complementing protein
VPLKQVPPRRNRKKSPSPEDDRQEQNVDLYAGYQTELYVPPAVKNGKVPKNRFGNIDIYTRNMIPPGAIHVRSPQGREAAAILGLDYADAITGFDFKGRQGTAVRDGVVVAVEFREAMVSVLDGLHYAQQQQLEEWRLERAIALWKRFITGMKIIARVNQYKNEAEGGGEDAEHDEDDLVDDGTMEEIEIAHEQETAKNFHYEIIEPPDFGIRAPTHLSGLDQADPGPDSHMDDDLEYLFDDGNVSEEKGTERVAADSQPNPVPSDVSMSKEVDEASVEQPVAMQPDTEMNEAGDGSEGSTASMLSHDPDDDDADPDWLD